MTGRKRRPTLVFRIAMLVVMYGAVYLFTAIKDSGMDKDGKLEQHYRGRKLLQKEHRMVPDDFLLVLEAEDENVTCTPRSIHQYPNDMMTAQQRKQGGVLVHVLITIYVFAALAIVCDDYFVSSIETICEVLKLQPDVAGATFMAAGSSAPELFTSVIGVFISQSDVGLGTIVGSAVFNILFIIALCGLFAGMVIYLTWWPLFRDTIFYLVSIAALAVIIYDNEVFWYEALVMLLLYIIYVIIMYFNPKIGDFMIATADSLKQRYGSKSTTSTNSDLIRENNEHTPLLGGEKEKSKVPAPTIIVEDVDTLGIHKSVEKYSEHIGFEHSHAFSEHTEPGDDYESPLTPPASIPKKIFWVLMLPASCVFMITIPDCRRPGCWQKMFPFTFVMSIAWIAGLSYIMVWMVTVIGDTLGIPDTVMGLTFLAAGTSVPDAMASVLVARDGYGDMAVSNSIGSNIFDILLCLGLPWLLQTTIVSEGNSLHINSNSLIFITITLFGTVIFLLVSMLINGWKLNKKFAVICLLVYIVVVIFACLFEMNVFFKVNLPQCAD